MAKKYVCNVATEEPLDLPKMNFGETKPNKSKPSEDVDGDEEQPLVAPTMDD